MQFGGENIESIEITLTYFIVKPTFFTVHDCLRCEMLSLVYRLNAIIRRLVELDENRTEYDERAEMLNRDMENVQVDA